jgi:hypothetical protein
MNPLLLLAVVLLTYPIAVFGLFILTFLVGLVTGKEEWIVPAWLGWLLRWFTAPWYGFSRVDAFTSGTTTVFMTGEPPEDLLLHEAKHRQESKDRAPSWLPRRLGLVVGALHYGLLYAWEYVRHGYWNNRFEIAAREAAGQD